MANTLYDLAREGFLDGSIDWDTGTIKMSLVRSGALNQAHKFVSDLTGAGGVLHATVTLASKTVALGVADAADITFTAPAANAGSHVLVIYQASAPGGGADVAASAQRLILWLDSYTGLPIVPNGADIPVTFPSDSNRIFKL